MEMSLFVLKVVKIQGPYIGRQRDDSGSFLTQAELPMAYILIKFPRWLRSLVRHVGIISGFAYILKPLDP